MWLEPGGEGGSLTCKMRQTAYGPEGPLESLYSLRIHHSAASLTCNHCISSQCSKRAVLFSGFCEGFLFLFLFYFISDSHLIVSIIFEQVGIKIPVCQTLLPLPRLLLFRKIGTETLLLADSEWGNEQLP